MEGESVHSTWAHAFLVQLTAAPQPSSVRARAPRASSSVSSSFGRGTVVGASARASADGAAAAAGHQFSMGAGLVAKDASLEEIRFTFDLCGFVLLPAVLDESECCAILAEVKEALRYREDAVASGARPGTPFAPGIAVRNHPNTNELRHPRHYHSWLSHAGLSGGLLDHPLLVPILNELLGESEPREGSYNFRCDDSMTLWREPGFTADELTPSPHGGGGQRARALGYHAQGQKIYAGSVRVVWELTGVPTDTCGGTLLLPGSHKASFPFPPVVKKAGTMLLWFTIIETMLRSTECNTHLHPLHRKRPHGVVLLSAR